MAAEPAPYLRASNPEKYEVLTSVGEVDVNKTDREWNMDRDQGGDVVDLVMAALACSESQALAWIETLLELAGPDELQAIKPEPDSFPIDALPSAAREFVQAWAEILGAPSELPGILAMGVASAALGSGIAVKSVNSLITYGNLYLLGGAISGLGKTSCARPIVQPLHDFQKKLLSEHTAKAKMARAKLQVVKEKIKGLEGGKAPSGSNSERGGDLLELRQQEADLSVVPPPPRILAEDVTTESLAVLAEQNDGVIANITADAKSAILNLRGRYGTGGSTNEDILLKGYSVEPHIQDRVTRAAVYTVPCFTIVWLTQLKNLRDLYTVEALADSGFLCRCLPFVVPDYRPNICEEEVQFPTAEANRFYARITVVLRQHYREIMPIVLEWAHQRKLLPAEVYSTHCNHSLAK